MASVKKLYINVKFIASGRKGGANPVLTAVLVDKLSYDAIFLGAEGMVKPPD